MKQYQKSETKARVPFHKLVWRGNDLVAVRYAKPHHLLRKPPAWSYHVEVIEAMQKTGVNYMEVVCNGKIYSCPLQRFLKYAQKHNRGYGEQMFLPLQYWDTEKEQVFMEEEKHGPKQLALFA